MDTERSLQAIANMNAKFSAVADRVARLDSLIGPGDLDSLKRAYFSICEIVEDLQALKGESVSIIVIVIVFDLEYWTLILDYALYANF